ncbi:hypothetical protein AMTRI_Chr06g178100 [Amborella trichopoda]|uniref:Myb-like domain-containing protein n=1 Tax=Amborella trichopoda TaxID=13333 RepID=U5D3W5_AMBTC|nr:uncharacterized protein LOC18448716 [Amborella trichopoda]ERN20306.1 hypothetical protein AMTR_s00066p00180460 [Amborella trichopoda]|eukprot:XP_006858839.1 uncharacterized protein LOC18448716 [Amborella trichopoda]
MAASPIPSSKQDGSHGSSCSNGTNGLVNGNPNHPAANCTAANGGHEFPGTVQALKHNPGIAAEWTQEEQNILDEGLNKYASEKQIIMKYAKIAMTLNNKTVRDVALRWKWMQKKEIGKRRKSEDQNMTRKSKDKKEKVNDPSSKQSTHLAARPSVSPCAAQIFSMDNDDGISYKAIGGATGQMLEQNAHMFNQISTNLASFQFKENIKLFCQTRDNITAILNDISDMPGLMKQMPPLPVSINEDLANSILPRPQSMK